MINFVSHLPSELRSGGFSAMNAAALGALGSRHGVHYVGPIDPPVSAWRKAWSKARRSSGGVGDFVAYSPERLDRIARAVEAGLHAQATLDFFHGFTYWLHTRPSRPYVAWSDCTFRDYIDIYHRRISFSSVDLQRIEEAEARWLKGARAVGFTSEWAANRALRDYKLEAARVVVVGIFGEVVPPDRDEYAGSSQFAFISTNFEAKGGPAVLAAFREVRLRWPQATLFVVGDRPSNISNVPGVTFTGFLRKEVAQESARLRELLAQSRALIHPTRSDITPLLLVEAGYFGCPVVSSRAFAIPEIVAAGETGLLLEDPTDVSAIADAMGWLLQAEEPYRAMRLAAFERARRLNSRARFNERMLGLVDGRSESRTAP